MRDFQENPYLSGFDDKDDIRHEFSPSSGGIRHVISGQDATAEDLEHLLFATYSRPAYEGYAEIYFMRRGEFAYTLWSVVGSHCSCYGLEGQWDPVETCVDAILKRTPEEWYKWGNEEKDSFQQFKEWLEDNRPLFEGEEDAE